MNTETEKTVNIDYSFLRSVKEGVPTSFKKFGRELKISPKTYVSIEQPPVGIKFNVPVISLTIGIGKDHVAYLFMDEEAWEAFKTGEEIIQTSIKEFKKTIN